jgi:hypothetical protein
MDRRLTPAQAAGQALGVLVVVAAALLLVGATWWALSRLVGVC